MFWKISINLFLIIVSHGWWVVALAVLAIIEAASDYLRSWR